MSGFHFFDCFTGSSPERLFVTVPRLKTGNPSSLNELVPGNEGDSPLLTPYPNWEANTVLDDQVNCDDTIISVFRTKVSANINHCKSPLN